MKIVYYLDLPSELYLWFGYTSVRSARKHMPDAEIVLLTMPGFPDVNWGVDEIIRLDELAGVPFARRRPLAYSSVVGDCLFLDVDCIVKRDVSHVFSSSFDVAMCLRYNTKVIKTMPFNGGVVFSRSQAFWRDVTSATPDNSEGLKPERTLSAVAMNDKYIVRVLNGHIYNYSPESENEDVSDKSIVHYKGRRKLFLFPQATEAAA